MSTEHIDQLIEEGIAKARELRLANEEERVRLLAARASADAVLEEGIVSGAALIRAAQQQHEDVSAELEHDLAQANRIAGVEPESRASDDEVDLTPPAGEAAVFDQDAEPVPVADEVPLDRTAVLPVNPTVPPTRRQRVRTRVSTSSRRVCTFVAVAAAAVAAIVTLAVMSNYYDDVLNWADGDAEWGNNWFVQALFIILPVILIAYGVWIICKWLFCSDDCNTTTETEVTTDVG